MDTDDETELVDLVSALQRSIDTATVRPVCDVCGHPHAGPRLGGICIGCPCPEVHRA